MSLPRIPAALRRLVRERAAGFCEYCRIHESEVVFPHEPDHIIAGQHDGATTADNLALACFQCNRLKGPNVAAVDPLTRAVERLFHPRQDQWRQHFTFTGHRVEALTSTGRASIALLRLNAPERLRLRAALIESGRLFA